MTGSLRKIVRNREPRYPRYKGHCTVQWWTYTLLSLELLSSWHIQESGGIWRAHPDNMVQKQVSLTLGLMFKCLKQKELGRKRNNPERWRTVTRPTHVEVSGTKGLPQWVICPERTLLFPQPQSMKGIYDLDENSASMHSKRTLGSYDCFGCYKLLVSSYISF